MLIHRAFLTAFLFLFISILAYPQNDHDIDSLELELKSAQYDSSRVIILAELAFKHGLNDNQKAIRLAKQAIQLAEIRKLKSGLMRAQYVLGRLYYEKGELDSAMIYLTKVRPYYENANDKKALFSINRDIAQIHQSRNNFDNAITYYEKSLSLSQEIGDPRMIGNSNNDLGSFYIRQYWNSDNDTTKKVELLTRSNEYLTEAQKFFEKANYKRGAALSLGNLSLIAFELKDYKNSLQYSQRALDYFNSLGEDIFSGIAYNQISKCYLRLGKLDEAESAALSCIEIGERMNSNYEIKDGYANLALINEKRGDYKKAYEYQRLYNEYENKIFNEESQARIDELEQEYRAVQRDKEIATLNIEKAIQHEHIGKQKQLLIFSFIFLAMLLVIITLLFRSYRQKKADNLALEQQKQKIELQNLELANMNGKIRDQNNKINQQNRKLKKLYEDHKGLMLMIVHDLQAPFNKIKGLSNILNLSVGLSPEQKEINDKIEHVAESGRALISDLTSISYYEDENIRARKESISINELIGKSLREFEPVAKKKSITILFSSLDEDLSIKTDPDFISRIIDNLLSNAIKYSPKKRNIFINIFTDDKQLKIDVQDQGPGISHDDQKNLFRKFTKLSARPTDGESSTGLGLSIVKTLVEKLDGQISVKSKLGEGTTFTVSIPLEMDFVNQF